MAVKAAAEPSLASKIVDYAPPIAAVDAAGNLLSGAVAAPVAGLAGMGAGAVNTITDVLGTPRLLPPAADVVGSVQSGMTYQPRTKLGQATVGAISYPFQKLAEGADWAGKKTAEATGSPAVGAAVNTGIQAIPALISPETRGAFASAGRALTGGGKIAASTAADAAAVAAATEKAKAYAGTAGLDWNALSDSLKAKLTSVAQGAGLEELDPAALAREAKLQSLPVPVPATRGQLTRDPVQLRNEGNVSTTSAGAPIRDVHLAANQALLDNLDVLKGKVSGTGDTAATATTPEQVGEFQEQGAVADLVDNSSRTDRATALENTTKTITSGSLEDVRNIKRTLLTGGDETTRTSGRQAWRDVRAQVIQGIKDDATKSVASNVDGSPNLTAAGLKRAIDRYGTPKLEEIFGPGTARQINAILDAAKDVKTLPPSREVGSSTLANVLTFLEKGITKVPVVGGTAVDIARGVAQLKNLGAGAREAKAATVTPLNEAVSKAAGKAARADYGRRGTFYGERFFRDFVISGTTVTANKAMVALMTAASGNQVNGIEFSGIAVTGGFQYCVYGYGWNRCTWRSCYFLNNTNGFWFIEQSIKVSLRDCFVIKSPIATHGDGSTALNCDQLAGIRPQDITATGCFFYGHDIGVSFGNVLYAAIDNCDLDQTLSTCVAITTVNGGCRVRNCWLDTNSASATTGVLINALGAANNDLILIDGNYTLCTQANAGSVGISVGAQQKSVVVTSNTIGTPGAPFATGMSIAGNNCVGKFNNIYASTTAITVNSSTADVEIGPNNVQNGTALTFSSGTPPGFSYFARGSFTITLTGMTAVITGTVNWAANGHTVTLSVPSAGILGTSNTTAMTGTGLPQYLWPNADKTFPAAPVNSGVAGFGAGQVAAATGIITFFRDIAGTAFTNVGTKGLSGLDSTYSYA
jgi:hypothetical protein